MQQERSFLRRLCFCTFGFTSKKYNARRAYCSIRLAVKTSRPLFSDCSIVRLFDCSIVRLFDCSIVRLFDCSIVRLFDCSIENQRHKYTPINSKFNIDNPIVRKIEEHSDTNNRIINYSLAAVSFKVKG